MGLACGVVVLVDTLQFDLWFTFAVESGRRGQVVFVLHVVLVVSCLGCS